MVVAVLSVGEPTPLVPANVNGPAVTLTVCLRTTTKVSGTVKASSNASPEPALPAMTTLNDNCVMLVPTNWIEPQAVPFVVPSHSVPTADATPVVRTKFAPVTTNWELPLRRLNETALVATEPLSVHELELDAPETPPRRSMCMTGLSTGLLKVIVTVDPPVGIVN